MSARPFPSPFPSPFPLLGVHPVPPPPAAAEAARWAALLTAAGEAWQLEAGRLSAVVRSPVVSGPCAVAMAECGDAVAGEIRSVAAQLARLGAALRLARTA